MYETLDARLRSVLLLAAWDNHKPGIVVAGGAAPCARSHTFRTAAPRHASVERYRGPIGAWSFELQAAYQNTFIASENVERYLESRDAGRIELRPEDARQFSNYPTMRTTSTSKSACSTSWYSDVSRSS